MNEIRQYEQIARYLSGEMSDSEKTLFEKWLLANPQNQALLDDSKVLWKEAKEDEAVFESNQASAWERFESKMDWDVQEKPLKKTSAKRISFFSSKKLMRAAAVFLLLLVGMLWIFQSNTNHDEWLVVKTSNGQQKEITLPDGSTITLNENSQLSYANNFETNRQLTLKGEAFFDVARDEDHPFLIESEKTITTVLGTSFNIRAYPNEPFVQLNVHSGKVSFAESMNTSKNIILEKGEAAKLDKKDWLLQKEVNSNKNNLAWKTKNLFFDNTALKTVVQDVQHCYGVSIKLQNDSLENCRFTGSFKNADLDEILKALQFALNIETSELENTFTLSGEACE